MKIFMDSSLKNVLWLKRKSHTLLSVCLVWLLLKNKTFFLREVLREKERSKLRRRWGKAFVLRKGRNLASEENATGMWQVSWFTNMPYPHPDPYLFTSLIHLLWGGLFPLLILLSLCLLQDNQARLDSLLHLVATSKNLWKECFVSIPQKDSQSLHVALPFLIKQVFFKHYLK